MRRQRKLSQQQLADDLGIKRSNIAAYETKNVEPRLSLINQIATYFSVSLADLIQRDLRKQAVLPGAVTLLPSATDHREIPRPAIREIEASLEKMQRAVDGFRAFYEFKRNTVTSTAADGESDIDNFLIFIEHITEYQRQIGANLDREKLLSIRSEERGN